MSKRSMEDSDGDVQVAKKANIDYANERESENSEYDKTIMDLTIIVAGENDRIYVLDPHPIPHIRGVVSKWMKGRANTLIGATRYVQVNTEEHITVVICKYLDSDVVIINCGDELNIYEGKGTRIRTEFRTVEKQTVDICTFDSINQISVAKIASNATTLSKWDIYYRTASVVSIIALWNITDEVIYDDDDIIDDVVDDAIDYAMAA